MGADRPTEMYKTWRHEVGETEDDAREWVAIDVRRAAQCWAAFAHRHLSGFEYTWPIVVRVRDPQGKLWDVMVDRVMVPEFEADKPQPVP